MDSRIVLDHKGAELLLGQGDMLFLSPRSSELIRAQGTLVDDMEIRKVVRYLKDVAEPSFERQLMQLRSPSAEPVTEEDRQATQERDPLFVEAVRIVVESQRGSVSLLQRRLAIGYTRASRLIEQMSEAGIIGTHKGSVAREVLLSPDEWEHMRQMLEEEDADGTLFAGKADESAGEGEGEGGADPGDNGTTTTTTTATTMTATTGIAASGADSDDDEFSASVEAEEAPFDVDDEGDDDDDEADDDEEEEGYDDSEGDEDSDDGADDEYEVEYVDDEGRPIADADRGAYDDDGDAVEDENGEYEYEYVYEEDEEDEEAKA